MVDHRKDGFPKAQDRRVRKRTRVLRNAKIIVPRRSPVIYCTVENITGGGACLKLASTFGVPETFDLTFEHGRTRRSCRASSGEPTTSSAWLSRPRSTRKRVRA
jgi:hypothetical protein